MSGVAAADPDLALELAKATEDLYAQAVDELVAIVARRARTGRTGTGQGWAERKLTEVRALQREAAQVVHRLATHAPGVVDTAVRSGYDYGGYGTDRVAVAGGGIVTHTRAVDQLTTEAVTRVTSTHGQILRSTVDAYRRVIADTAALTTTGVWTTKDALAASLQRFADRGITGFVDRAGRQWRLDRYAAMAVRTAVGRAQVAGTLDRLVDDGRDLVIVSDHSGTCQVCAPWEAKVLSITGATSGRTVDGDGHQVAIAGTVADAQRAGLQHPNCRHALTAFTPGLTVAPDPVGPDPEGDERRRQQAAASEQERRASRRRAATTGRAPRPQVREPVTVSDPRRPPTSLDKLLKRSGAMPEDVRAYLEAPLPGGQQLQIVDWNSTAQQLTFRADVLDESKKRIGYLNRTVDRDARGRLQVHNDLFSMNPYHQGQGIGSSVYDRLDTWYRASGVHRTYLNANIDKGSYAWARAGFDWDPAYARHNTLFARGRIAELQRLAVDAAPEVQQEVLNLARRATGRIGTPDFPTPLEISQVGRTAKATSWIGKEVMLNQSWFGEKLLR